MPSERDIIGAWFAHEEHEHEHAMAAMDRADHGRSHEHAAILAAGHIVWLLERNDVPSLLVDVDRPDIAAELSEYMERFQHHRVIVAVP